MDSTWQERKRRGIGDLSYLKREELLITGKVVKATAPRGVYTRAVKVAFA